MIYEVVTGQVFLAKRRQFQEMHQQILVPTYISLDIKIVACLICDVGRIGEFVDIYAYEDYNDYDRKTILLEEHLWNVGYYPQIQECITGSIQVQLMSTLNKDYYAS